MADELEQPRIHVFVETMDAAVREHVPSYEDLPHAAGFRAGLERMSVAYCRTLRERERLDEKEQVRLHLIGAQRARMGLVPDEMAKAVDIAVGAAWRFGLATLRELGAAGETIEAVSAEAFPLALAFAGDVRAGLLLGYRSDGAEHLPAQVRVNATVIDRLLAGGSSDEELFEAIRAHAVDVRPPCGLLVVTSASRSEPAALRPASTAMAALPGVIEGPGRWATVPAHTVLVASAVADWPALLAKVSDIARARRVVVVAAEAPVERLVHLSDAYQAVEATLHLAQRATRDGGLVRCRTLALLRTLSCIPPEERIELVRETLGPVLDNRKGEHYLEAYEAWLEANCDATAAGALIYEPPHTVRYRVGMVEKLTSIAAKSGEGRLRLDLAVLLWRAWVRELLVDQYVRQT